MSLFSFQNQDQTISAHKNDQDPVALKSDDCISMLLSHIIIVGTLTPFAVISNSVLVPLKQIRKIWVISEQLNFFSIKRDILPKADTLF